MDHQTCDRIAIREVIENWVIWRDAGAWERFATVWHPEGVMCATWQQSSAAEFIQGCRAGWERGAKVLHALGGSSIELNGDRAVAQTKMTINQRAKLDGLEVDVTCQGRFFDLFERVDGGWKIFRRQPIYERDRMDPVDPGDTLILNKDILARFPDGYRHLAYLQTHMGYEVKANMPGTKGAEVEALYAMGRAWLGDEFKSHTMFGSVSLPSA